MLPGYGRSYFYLHDDSKSSTGYLKYDLKTQNGIITDQESKSLKIPSVMLKTSYGSLEPLKQKQQNIPAILSRQ